MKDTINPIFGYSWETIDAMQHGKYIRPTVKRVEGKDCGADPLGDGMFKMFPSGDVVDYVERCKRLGE
jgi:hypothetical protein